MTTPTPGDDDLARLYRGIAERLHVQNRRRIRNRAVAAGVGALLALGLTGGAIAVIQATATEKTVSLCFGSADLGAASTEVASPPASGRVSEAVPGMDDRIRTAEDQCAAVWRIGFFEEDGGRGSGSGPGSGPAVVPALTTCVLADGRLGVFPGTDDTCRGMGLRPAAAPGATVEP